MELERVLEVAKERLSAERFLHVEGTVAAAAVLGERFGEGPVKEWAMIAAALHDIAKCEPEERLRALLKEDWVTSSHIHWEDYGKQLWHGPAGAVVAKKELGITNDTILNAIRYHTTGYLDMTMIDKIVFVADSIEARRNMPWVDECRKISDLNLDLAVLYSYRKRIEYLLEKRILIHPYTILGYNEMLREVG